MKTMGTDGQRIPTPEEREHSPPMQTIMPRWLNNVLVMTAMTTVLMIIILVLLAKHFKMKALVSMLTISSLPLPIEVTNLTAAVIASALVAPNPVIGTKVRVCISSGGNMAKYTWIFGISICKCPIFQTSHMVQRIQVQQTVCPVHFRVC